MMDYLDKQKADHDTGDPLAVHNAILFCVWNKKPIPEWAFSDIERMVEQDINDRPGRGKGQATPAQRAFRMQRDISWYSSVEIHRALGMTLQEAKACVDQIMRNKNKRLPKNAVTAAYEREARRRRLNKKGA